MADPFIAEIRMFSGTTTPKGWAACEGQLLPINQNQALFALLGTTYGGDGQRTFALPDLRNRAPLGADASHPLGSQGPNCATTGGGPDARLSIQFCIALQGVFPSRD